MKRQAAIECIRKEKSVGGGGGKHRRRWMFLEKSVSIWDSCSFPVLRRRDHHAGRERVIAGLRLNSVKACENT